MPNIKSAKKRVKVIATKTLRNKAIKSELKTYVKKAQNAEENKAEAVRVAIRPLLRVSCTRIPLPERNPHWPVV